jgi:16S rRNA processing protein RimM
MRDKSTLCVARILTAHGVRGLVKLRCFLENPDDFKNYQPVLDNQGHAFFITLKNPIKGDFIAEIKDITTRNQAETLRNVDLFIAKSQLPPLKEDQIYLDDLQGFDVHNTRSEKIGHVVQIENFGAGHLLSIQLQSGKRFFLPLQKPYVTTVDKNNGSLHIDQYEDFLD